MPSPWRDGYPPCFLEDISEDERCPSCRGKGASMSRHRFIGGHAYMPCPDCDNSVTVEDMPEVAPPAQGTADLDELTVEELEQLEAIATRLQEAKARNNVIDMEAARRDATDVDDG